MSYISQFGVVRTYGLGEGSPVPNDAGEVVFAKSIIKVSLKELEAQPAANSGTGFGKGIAYIPKGAYILSVTACSNAASAATVGTYKKDGTVVDADGLVAANGIVAGAKAGAGAQVGGIAADDLYIKAAGSLTGVDGFVLVEYTL